MPKTILMLGAGPWQTPYLLKARAMGLRVVATDWSPEAFGRGHADVFAPIDLQRHEETLAFARAERVDAVFTAADIGVPTAAYVAEHMGFPYHSTDLALNATNKYRMREQAARRGLPIPAYAAAASVDEALAAAERIGYPVIMKPVDSCASRGVFRVSSAEDLRRLFPESQAASFGKVGTVLIEEFMTGTEGSVEALVTPDGPVFLGICDKTKSPLPYRFDLELAYPGAYAESQYKAIRRLIARLVDGFGIARGIIHVEIMVDGDRVRLIEFGLRGCGSNVVTRLLPAMTGFDVPAYLLSEALGERGTVPPLRGDAGVLRFLMAEPGPVGAIEGAEAARRMPGFVDLYLGVRPGDRIGEAKNGGDRAGYVMAVGGDRREALARAEAVAKAIQIRKGV